MVLYFGIELLPRPAFGIQLVPRPEFGIEHVARPAFGIELVPRPAFGIELVPRPACTYADTEETRKKFLFKLQFAPTQSVVLARHATAGYYLSEEEGGRECHVYGASVTAHSEADVWVALAEGQLVQAPDVDSWTSVPAAKVCLYGCKTEHTHEDGTVFFCNWQLLANPSEDGPSRGMTRRCTFSFRCLDLVSDE